MPTARSGPFTPAQAVARMDQLVPRRAGAWNRQARAAVRDNLELAIEMGEPRLKLNYGGLIILHQLVGDDGKPLRGKVTRVDVHDANDEHMDEDLAAEADEPAPAAVVSPAQPQASSRDDPAVAAAAAAARVEALEKKAAVRTEARRRQKLARRKRDEAARLLAAQTGAPSNGAGAPETQVHVPLWSTSMGQSAAMVRLLGEVTQRCAVEAGRRGVPTCAVSAVYGGRAYSVSVLSGTVAVQMEANKRGEELLALLGSGLTEEDISVLLRRWSQAAAAPSSSSSLSSAKAKASAFSLFAE